MCYIVMSSSSLQTFIKKNILLKCEALCNSKEVSKITCNGKSCLLSIVPVRIHINTTQMSTYTKPVYRIGNSITMKHQLPQKPYFAVMETITISPRAMLSAR